MTTSHQTHETVDEVVPLNTIPGTGDAQHNDIRNPLTSGQGAASRFHDPNHRKLAICSIICGISCIGIKALVNSVKAETTVDPERAAKFSKRAKKLSIISIVTWVSILASIPILMALISYLITLQD